MKSLHTIIKERWGSGMSVLTILDDTIWIDLPDGRQLSARLWLPKTGHSYPVIFEYLPYRKRDGTAERDARMA